jgi:hypothetical protein
MELAEPGSIAGGRLAKQRVARANLSALLGMLEPYGVREIVQSGMVAVGRGARSITATTPR